jgi:hypothetical protein
MVAIGIGWAFKQGKLRPWCQCVEHMSGKPWFSVAAETLPTLLANPGGGSNGKPTSGGRYGGLGSAGMRSDSRCGFRCIFKLVKLGLKLTDLLLGILKY